MKTSAVYNKLLLLVAAIFLSSCSSTSDPAVSRGAELGWRSGSGSGSEEYRGRFTAAVAPVTGPTLADTPRDDRLQVEIQRNIQRQLDQSGIFAGVITLDRPDEGNEAEVIIEPTLFGPGVRGSGDVGLRVRVSEKSNHRTVLNRTYRNNDARPEALILAVTELENDLADRYGR
jgi:hypothetical protein